MPNIHIVNYDHKRFAQLVFLRLTKRHTKIDRFGASVQYPDFLSIHLSHSVNFFVIVVVVVVVFVVLVVVAVAGVVAVVFLVVTTIVVPLTFLIVARFILFEESGRFPTEISV